MSGLGASTSDLRWPGSEVGESTSGAHSPAFEVHRSASDLGVPT